MRKLLMTTTVTTAMLLSAPAANAQEWLGAKWSGLANAGLTITSGNSDTQAFNADAKAGARWTDQRAELRADFNQEESNDVDTVDNQLIGGNYDYFFAPKWFATAGGSFETDDIALLDLRSRANTGIGHQMFERDDLNLKFILGPGYLDEEFSNGTSFDSVTAAWALDYDQKFYEDAFRVFHNHTIDAPFDGLSDNWLFKSKTGVRLPIVNGILATAQVDYDYDKSPAAGQQEDDTTYAVKLGYEW